MAALIHTAGNAENPHPHRAGNDALTYGNIQGVVPKEYLGETRNVVFTINIQHQDMGS